MFIDNFLNALLRPFREIYSQWQRVRGIKGGIEGDARRVKMIGSQAQGYGQMVTGAPGQMGKAMGFGGKPQAPQAPQMGQMPGMAGMPQMQQMQAGSPAGKTKMSWWPWGKKVCPGCRNKLHKSWDKCPYCGMVQGAGAPPGMQPGMQPGMPGMQPGMQPGMPGYPMPGQSGGMPGMGMGPMPTPGMPQRTIAMSVDQIQAPLLSTGDTGENLGWLVPLEGPQIGELFQIKGKATIGTAEGVELKLFDASISGRHAEVKIDGQNRFRITDLGSTNGTYVNDKKIESTDLVDGDNIRLGRTTFRFKTRR